ncbi:MAG: hypothetical protein AAF915_11940 [Cyanobacteria bacterium P01_D01_bin.50]
MAYNEFTISKVKKQFGIKLIEDSYFITEEIEIIQPADYINQYLEQTLTIATASGSEKARSELIITPILVELRRIWNKQIAILSGEEFNVDPSIGLNGRCDYIISASPEIYEIESPVIIIVEAKKLDVAAGIGQCIAAMIAAEKFNFDADNNVPCIYGCVTTGSIWRFLKLFDNTVIINPDYYLPPTDKILSILNWIVQQQQIILPIPNSQFLTPNS